MIEIVHELLSLTNRDGSNLLCIFLLCAADNIALHWLKLEGIFWNVHINAICRIINPAMIFCTFDSRCIDHSSTRICLLLKPCLTQIFAKNKLIYIHFVHWHTIGYKSYRHSQTTQVIRQQTYGRIEASPFRFHLTNNNNIITHAESRQGLSCTPLI